MVYMARGQTEWAMLTSYSKWFIFHLEPIGENRDEPILTFSEVLTNKGYQGNMTDTERHEHTRPFRALIAMAWVVYHSITIESQPDNTLPIPTEVPGVEDDDDDDDDDGIYDEDENDTSGTYQPTNENEDELMDEGENDTSGTYHPTNENAGSYPPAQWQKFSVWCILFYRLLCC